MEGVRFAEFDAEFGAFFGIGVGHGDVVAAVEKAGYFPA